MAQVDSVSATMEVLEGISHLSVEVNKQLRSGQPLSTAQLAECVCCALMRYPAWVLDGFPADKAQVVICCNV